MGFSILGMGTCSVEVIIMAYLNQIRILEAKVAQLKNLKLDTEITVQIWGIEAEIRKLKRLEWEENYERIKMEEER